MYVCMYIYTYVYPYIHICIYLCTSIYIHRYTHISHIPQEHLKVIWVLLAVESHSLRRRAATAAPTWTKPRLGSRGVDHTDCGM